MNTLFGGYPSLDYPLPHLMLALPLPWGGDTIADQGDINMKSLLDNF